ncbi:olfactory receptor 14J1-like [Calonectris borealis]|uniref:olfactory receptor 14J1-like n=1 Tax=Calonectris borealis TaxID=1323832 RepID=UPI003F4C5BBB
MMVCSVTWFQDVSAETSSNRGGVTEDVMKVMVCSEGQSEYLIEQIFGKEKVLRKKYTVLWRLDSTTVVSTMKPFPMRTMQQMIRKPVKCKLCRLVWTANPRRRNPGAEYYTLTIMAYDRYVAICQPLHYGTLLGSRACVHMAAAAWGNGFLTALLHTANTFSLPLCKGNAVDQFFCEIPPLLKLSCSHTFLREVGLLVVNFSFSLGCFIFIVVSYVQIFRAVLRIPSDQGQHKTFSTCLPHLAVVSLFVSTAMFAYLKPPSISSPSLDLVVTVLYSVVPPALNPLIYSMRNQELKDALKKLIESVVSQQQ